MSPTHEAGCLVCGAPLRYLEVLVELPCACCGAVGSADARCEGSGHFVCDACHGRAAFAVIEHLCRTSAETDMHALLATVRAHQSVAMHGPEHHAIVPAVILTCYRNLGGAVTDEQLASVITRGAKIPGGFCGFAGTCGAAVGVGIAFAALIGSSPVKADERATSLRVTQAVLGALAELQAARCCQRDAWVALAAAAELSVELLDRPLIAAGGWTCQQSERNRQCLGPSCPLHPPGPADLSKSVP